MIGHRSPLSRSTIVLLALLWVVAPALAAPPRVTVQADRKEAQVGQPVLLTVRVRGAEEAPTVKPPVVAGVPLTAVGPPAVVPTLAADLEAQGVFHAGRGQHLVNALRGLGQMPDPAKLDPDLAQLLGDPSLLRGQMQAAQAIAGLTTNDYSFTYLVTPQRPGPLAIPAFTVTTRGQALTTQPLSITVTEARAQPWVRVGLSLSNATPQVGEEVKLYLDLLIERGQVVYGGKTYPYLPLSKMSLTLPALDGLPQLELAQPLEQFVQANAIEPGKHGFRVNGFAGEVKLEHEPAGAADLDPARYRRRLAIPLRLREGGEVTLGPAHAAGEVYVALDARKGRWQPFVAASAPLTFSVLDLRRQAGRPADFTGVVGNVRVTAQASATEMAAGTPFTLTVRLEGNGSVIAAGGPDLAARPEFAQRFRVRAGEAHSAGEKAREFTYTLRPLNEQVTEIPPVPVSYFDPQAKHFATTRSEPIPLRVTPAPNLTPATPPPAPAPAAAAPPPPPIEEAIPESDSGSAGVMLWVELAMAAVLMTCAMLWVAGRWRRSRRPPIAPPEPLPVAIPVVRPGPLPPPPTYARVRQSLQDFLRRHFLTTTGEVTSRDAEAALRQGGVASGLARSLAALLDTCETAEFAPGLVTAAPAELDAYARQLMGQIIASLPVAVA